MSKWKASAIAAFLVGTVGSSSAGVDFYVAPDSFGAAIAGTTTFLGSEDFESSSLADGSSVSFDDSLAPGVPNGPFASGTNPAIGLTVQSNTGGNPGDVLPRGRFGLATASKGYFGTPDDQVSTNFEADSLDLILVSPVPQPILAVSLRPLYFDSISGDATGTITISVFDTANNLLGSTSVTGVEYQNESSFVGIVANGSSAIGRINLWDGSALHFQGVDDIDVFAQMAPIPELSTSTLLLSGLALAQIGLLVRRRQRESRAA